MEIPEGYALVEVERLQQLHQLEEELYADKVNSGDKQRNWANWLNQVFF